MNTPMTLEMLIGLLGAVVALGALILSLHAAIKKQFEDMNHKSETRSIHLHERINSLGDRIHQQYLPRETFTEAMKRLDDAQIERDRTMAELNDRLNCPTRGAH